MRVHPGDGCLADRSRTVEVTQEGKPVKREQTIDEHRGDLEAVRQEEGQASRCKPQASERRYPQPDPPLLIGGSKHDQARNRAKHAGLDWLTMTVSEHGSRRWRAISEGREPGRPQDGFKRSEQRAFEGGTGWRKSEPIGESSRFGTQYESWEIAGPTADEVARSLVTRPWEEADGYATRIDVCWDFDVPEWVMPHAVIERWGKHITETGRSVHAAGEIQTGTRYIGSPKSTRLIRVYRTDLKRAGEGPTIRLELVLKAEWAESAWTCIASQGVAAGVRDLANTVLEMTGFNPQPGGNLTPRPVRPAQGVINSTVAMLRSYGPLLMMLIEEGVDVIGLAQERSERTSPASKSKMRTLREQLRKLDVSALEAAVRAGLGRCKTKIAM